MLRISPSGANLWIAVSWLYSRLDLSHCQRIWWMSKTGCTALRFGNWTAPTQKPDDAEKYQRWFLGGKLLVCCILVFEVYGEMATSHVQVMRRGLSKDYTEQQEHWKKLSTAKELVRLKLVQVLNFLDGFLECFWAHLMYSYIYTTAVLKVYFYAGLMQYHSVNWSTCKRIENV